MSQIETHTHTMSSFGSGRPRHVYIKGRAEGTIPQGPKSGITLTVQFLRRGGDVVGFHFGNREVQFADKTRWRELLV
jgi:hypothetical protein